MSLKRHSPSMTIKCLNDQTSLRLAHALIVNKSLHMTCSRTFAGRAREADRKREADLRIEARQVREANKARAEASKCLILHSTESKIP